MTFTAGWFHFREFAFFKLHLNCLFLVIGSYQAIICGMKCLGFNKKNQTKYINIVLGIKALSSDFSQSPPTKKYDANLIKFDKIGFDHGFFVFLKLYEASIKCNL